MSPKCIVSSQSQGHGEGDLYGHGKAGYEDLERRGPGEAARGPYIQWLCVRAK